MFKLANAGAAPPEIWNLKAAGHRDGPSLSSFKFSVEQSRGRSRLKSAAAAAPDPGAAPPAPVPGALDTSASIQNCPWILGLLLFCTGFYLEHVNLFRLVLMPCFTQRIMNDQKIEPSDEHSFSL